MVYYLGPSLVKLANIAALFPGEDYEKIAWQNAASFFRLDIADAALSLEKVENERSTAGKSF
jgi:hypothetical protein